MKIPFTAILLAGGVGTRMNSSVPKQFILVQGKPLALHSFGVFAAMPELEEIIVVCDPAYRSFFSTYEDLKYALPGKRRQDSVFNGIQLIKGNPLVCIHDAARPLITEEIVRKTILAAHQHQAAVIGVKSKATVKICDTDDFVVETPQRDFVWEVQTPQAARLNLLQEGFKMAERHQLTVTDDVSLVELLGKPVKVVEGNYTNIKVTTPDDLIIAEQYLEAHALLQAHPSL